MTLKAIVLNFHGTVANDEGIREQVIADLLLSQNLRPNPQDYRQVCWGRNSSDCWRDLLQMRGRFPSDETLKQLLTEQDRAYRDAIVALKQLPLYPGIEAFLRKLQGANLQVALITSLPRATLIWLWQQLGLSESMFAAAITGDETWKSPPQPDVYDLALKSLQHHFPTLELQAENCLAIDHTFPGIDAAQHAGMQVVGISHTYPLHMLQRHASWAIDKFSELELERIEADFAQRNANPAA